MQKGKFGFSLWLYPYIALWALCLWSGYGMVICVALSLFVAVTENNEWCTKQCLKAVLIAIYWGVYNLISNAFYYVPIIKYANGLIDTVITACFCVLVLVIGLKKLMNGEELSFPGMSVIDKAFGHVQQFVAPQSQGYQQGAPYQQPPTAATYQQPPTAATYQQPAGVSHPQVTEPQYQQQPNPTQYQQPPAGAQYQQQSYAASNSSSSSASSSATSGFTPPTAPPTDSPE